MQKRWTHTVFLQYGLSFLCILFLWEAAALSMRAPLILPFPADVFKSLYLLVRQNMFWMAVGATVIRCFVSFFISLIAGTVLGTVCGMSDVFRNFSAVPLSIVRSTPVVSFILLALFWFTSSTVPVFVSVLMTLPVMITSVSSGFRKQDMRLSAMARLYGFTRMQQFRWITVPAVMPYFLTGAVSCFGLTWKVVAAGEVLCLPKHGTGTLMQTAQVHLETQQVLAVTIVLVFLSFVLEQLFAYAVSRCTGRRQQGAEP